MIVKNINIDTFEIENESIFKMGADEYIQRATALCNLVKTKKPQAKCEVDLTKSNLNNYWNIPVLNNVKNADFAIVHLYSPDMYFDTNYFYYSDLKNYSFYVKNSGNYIVSVSSVLRDAGYCIVN